MADYDALVKELRDEAEYADLVAYMHGIKSISHGDATAEVAGSWAQLFHKAADAIEKFIEVIQNHDFLESLINPRWIPVTERLPDSYEDVMLKFPNNQAVGFCDRDGCWGVYSGDGFYTEVAENEPKPTHWAKKLPEPPKEEDDG